MKGELKMAVTRKRMRKGATGKVYTIKTVEDIFLAVNRGNYKRFLSDFKTLLEVKFALQDSFDAFASAEAKKDVKIPFSSTEFDWKDD